MTKVQSLQQSLACAVAAAFLSPALVFADTDSELDLNLVVDRISITGSAAQMVAIPGSAHAIGSEELERHSYGDIHRILRTVPGVNVHEEDGFGLFPHIGLRGTRLERNSRITAMEDGVLIAPAPYAAPAAYYFPQTARMSGVELRKGSAAIKYGPYTTGGAVNLLSTRIPSETGGRASLLFGEHGSRRAHAWLGGSSDQWGWLVEGYSAASDGFKQLDRVPSSPRPNSPQPSTGFQADNYLAKLRWNSSGPGPYQLIELKLAKDERTADETYLGLTREDFQAAPYRRYRGSALDQINTDHELAQLRHFIMLGDTIDLTTTVYNHEFSRNWYKLHEVQNTPGGGYVGISSILTDPSQHTAALGWIRGAPHADLLGNVRANNREYFARGIQSQFNWQFDTAGLVHELEIGARFHRDEEDRLQWQDSFRMIDGSLVLVRPGQEQGEEAGADTGVPGSTTNRVTGAEAIAVWVQDTIRHGDWTLTPGLRMEDIDFTRIDYFEGDEPSRERERRRMSESTRVVLPGFGATYQLNPEVTLLAGVNRGFAPTGIGTVEEKSWNYEAGLRYRSNGIEAALIGFHTRYDNLVGVCTAISGGSCEIGEQFDGGRVDVTGLEAEFAHDLGRAGGLGFGIPLSLAYTWTSSKFQRSFQSSFGEWGEVVRGDELPQIPEHQINAGIGLAWDHLSLNLNANYVGTTRAVAGSGPIPVDERVDSRLLFDLSAEYRVHVNAALFASVENLTDETYLTAWRPSGARPGMPRTGWLGARISF